MVLAESVVAPFDLPPFDRSSVDGYGLRAADAGRTLTVVGEVAAGDDPAVIQIGQGEAVRLFTGSPIPPGVDAVVMQEDIHLTDGIGTIGAPVRPGDFIRRRGAEVMAGAEVIPARTLATPPVLSLLATLGATEAEFFLPPRVRIVATGNELVSPSRPLGPGQVFESVIAGLCPAIEAAGGMVISRTLVRDDPTTLRQVLDEALIADVVITCGGVSVGDHDLIRPTLTELGVETRIWGVAMRPGKPFYYGVGPNGQRVFGLPGNPVSALVTFYLLVRPVLLGMSGRHPASSHRLPLRTDEPIPEVGNRDDFLRARTHDDGVRLESAQESHMLTGLANATALVRLPAHSGPYVYGDSVEVIPIDWR